MKTDPPVLQAEPPVTQAPPPPPPRCQPRVTFNVHAVADNSTVTVNTTVHLTGTAEETAIFADCSEETNDLPFTWSLTVRSPPSAPEAPFPLTDPTTLTPSFTPDREGTYTARLTARSGRRSITAKAEITAIGGRLRSPPGQLSLLSVNEIGDDSSLFVDSTTTEVTVALNNNPMTFGFQVRNDRNRPAHQGMLDLLRDAFNNNWTVTVDYFTFDDMNGLVKRVDLSK
jgi:hypothetical protein